jgi:regulatory protein
VVITAIERTRGRRGRVDVYVDGLARLQLGRELVRMRRLRPGDFIETEQLEALAEADARASAMQAAVAMLARRQHSEREVRRKLALRRVATPIIEETIAKLLAARLIDDAEFARSWVQARDEASPRGRRLLTQELRMRGVQVPVATAAAAAVADDEAAYRAAERRARSLASLDHATFRSRMASFLQRRGFGWETARAAIEHCWREIGGAVEFDD